jgi:hypothetical protein
MFGMKMPKMGKSSPEVLTAADGTFVMEDVAPMGMGAILYHQPPKGFTSAEETAGMAGTLMIMLNEKGEPNPVELRYRPTAGLGGIVYLPDGTTPAADVRVSARPDGRTDQTEAMTGKDGRFRVDVPPGAGVEVRATTEATVASVYTKIPDKGAPADVTLTLQAYAIVSGTVKDSEGNPVKGINVSQHSRSGDSMIGFMRLPGMTAAQAISDVDGHYEITKLEPGEVTIQARVNNGFMMGASTKGGREIHRTGADRALHRRRRAPRRRRLRPRDRRSHRGRRPQRGQRACCGCHHPCHLQRRRRHDEEPEERRRGEVQRPGNRTRHEHHALRQPPRLQPAAQG